MNEHIRAVTHAAQDERDTYDALAIETAARLAHSEGRMRLVLRRLAAARAARNAHQASGRLATSESNRV